jgi:hypothetical protein
MSARIHISLWVGCALVAVLELPHSGAQLGQDIRRFWEHGAVLGDAPAPSPEVSSDSFAVAALPSTPIYEEPSPGELDR